MPNGEAGCLVQFAGEYVRRMQNPTVRTEHLYQTLARRGYHCLAPLFASLRLECAYSTLPDTASPPRSSKGVVARKPYQVVGLNRGAVMSQTKAQPRHSHHVTSSGGTPTSQTSQKPHGRRHKNSSTHDGNGWWPSSLRTCRRTCHGSAMEKAATLPIH